MQGLPEPLSPPVLQGQIQTAAGRGAEPSQEGLQGLTGLGLERLQPWRQGLELGGNGVGRVMPVPRIEATGLPPARDAVLLQLQQQVLDSRGRAAANGQGHRFAEAKTAQTEAHRDSTAPSSWHGSQWRAAHTGNWWHDGDTTERSPSHNGTGQLLDHDLRLPDEQGGFRAHGRDPRIHGLQRGHG